MPLASKPAPRIKTEAELEEEKRRRDLRNINITLYSASLLLVAAAALFIGLAIPAQARFFGVVAVTVLFYVSGLVIHSRSRRLRPAAVAFTGTGLALIPVAGLALFNFVLPDGPAAWLVTSLIGTAAFAYAAARIESRVVTYLALTFLLSSGLASGAALQWGIVWYFLFTVILATLISLAAVRRPAWLNNLYVDAFVRSHHYLVPATAVASVQIAGKLSSGQLSVLFLAFAVYYAVMLWQGPTRNHLVNSYGLRAAGTVGLTALFYSFTSSSQLTLVVFSLQVAAQTAGVLLRRPIYGAAALLQVAARGTGLPLDREDGDGPGLHGETASGAQSMPHATADTGGTFRPVPAGAGKVGLRKKPATPPEVVAGRFFRADVAALLILQAGTGLTAGLWHALQGPVNAAVFAATAVVVLLTYLGAAWKLGGLLEYTVLVPWVLAFVPSMLLPAEGPWPGVLATAILNTYLVVRAVRSRGREQLVFVLAARACAVLLVPLILLAVLTGRAGGDAGAWALTGGILALTANQVASVIRTGRGKPELYPGTAVCVAAGAAAVLTLQLSLQQPPIALTFCGLCAVVVGNALTSALRPGGRYLVFAPAGFAAAALIGAGVLGVRGYALLAAAALCYCAVLAGKLAPSTHRTYYVAAAQVQLTILAALVTADAGAGVHGVFIAMAVCLAGQHLARIILDRRLSGLGLSQPLLWATLLVLAMLTPVYYILTYTAVRPSVGVFLLLVAAGSAAIAQCAYTLGASGTSGFGTVLRDGRETAVRFRSGLRGPYESAPRTAVDAVAAASLVLLLSMGVRMAGEGSTAATLAVLTAGLAVNIFTALMLRRSWPALAAPAGFAAFAVLGAGVLGLRGYEVLVVVAIAYCSHLIAGRTNVLRGAYLLAAQVLAVVLAGITAADLSGDVHQVFPAVAVCIAAGQVLRILCGRRLDHLGLALCARWGGLLAAAGVPLAYAWLPGEPVRGGLMTFLVLCAAAVAVFSQLAVAVWVRRGTPLPFAAEFLTAAALVTLLATGATRAIDGQGPGWPLVLLWTALAANIATSLMVPGKYEPAALAGFAAAAAVGFGVLGLHGYELLVMAALAYCAYPAGKRQEPNSGLYLLGVQALLVVLTVLVAADLDAGVHGVYVAGALALAVQQLLRTLMRRRLDEGGYSETSQWLSLGLLALLPAYYALDNGTSVRRGVVVLCLVLLLGTAVAAFAQKRAEQHTRSAWVIYPVAYAAGALFLVLTNVLDFATAGFLPEPLLGRGAAGVALLLLSVAALYGEARMTLDKRIRNPLLVATAGYTSTAILATPAAGNSFLLAAAFVLGGVTFLVLSYSRSRPWMSVGLPPLLMVGMLLLFRGREATALPGIDDAGYSYLLPVWAAAALLQGLRWLSPLARVETAGPDGPARGAETPGVIRRRILGSASALILTAAAVPAMAPDVSAAAAALTVLAALGLVLIEVPRPLRETAAQGAALVAALAVQRIGWLVLGEVSGFWALQYWACVLAGMAAYEFLRHREQRGTVILACSAVVLSASGLSTVIFGGGGRQLWALVAHAGLLAFGLLASRRVFTLWGAGGVVLAVLWYLRGYTFLLLALLGVGLIALAVWRLTRVRPEEPGAAPVPTNSTPEHPGVGTLPAAAPEPGHVQAAEEADSGPGVR